jgi:hypothetical protein
VADAVDISPPRFAGLVAPAIDRVFRRGMAAGRERGGRELVARHGGSERVGVLIEFRTSLAWPGRVVEPAQLAAIVRYRDLDEAQRHIDGHVQRGTLERTGDGGFRATSAGQGFLVELYGQQAEAMADHWRDDLDRVGRLNGVLHRLLQAATVTGGDAFAAMAPAFEPDGAAPGLLLLNRLSCLRYHRADAHAAAWVAAGLTGPQIVALRWGRERELIEAETDRRAAPPYEVLAPEERIGMLADLAALPG